MGRFMAIPASEHHGWYVENTWTGRTVCDMYFIRDGTVHHHEDAEANARKIAAHLDATTEE